MNSYSVDRRRLRGNRRFGRLVVGRMQDHRPQTTRSLSPPTPFASWRQDRGKVGSSGGFTLTWMPPAYPFATDGVQQRIDVPAPVCRLSKSRGPSLDDKWQRLPREHVPRGQRVGRDLGSWLTRGLALMAGDWLRHRGRDHFAMTVRRASPGGARSVAWRCTEW
jgi:hypothetical protein